MKVSSLVDEGVGRQVKRLRARSDFEFCVLDKRGSIDESLKKALALSSEVGGNVAQQAVERTLIERLLRLGNTV